MTDQPPPPRRKPAAHASSATVGMSAAEENVRTVARIHRRSAQRRTVAQRLSDRVAAVAAHETTIVLHLIWFTGWILANTGVLPTRPFDPFPFGLLTMIVSLEAIFLSLFLLASQNRLTQEADRRAHLDLQVDLLAEQEMTLVLRMLQEVCEHLGLEKTIRSQKFVELVQRTDIGQLAERVERNLGLEKV